MDQSDLLMLIAQGEHEGQDFKRLLDLDTRDSRGEFVKDVISIANSAPGGRGHILIGVDDDGIIVGTEPIDDDRLQQIAHRYIRPTVTLRCSMVPTDIAGNAWIGAVEIQGRQRPYSVVSAVGKLRQDDTFVRHGSVVTRATTEEISLMQETTLGYQYVSQFVRAAETHTRLGDYARAIDAYTEAITLHPASELYLARGRVYSRQVAALEPEHDDRGQCADSAVEDFGHAIELATTVATEVEARLGRLSTRFR